MAVRARSPRLDASPPVTASAATAHVRAVPRATLPATIALLAMAACSQETAPAPTPPPPAASEDCVLSRVIDGDSIRCADGREIRLLSIDAPEMAQEPWGERSREELLRMAPINTALRTEYDVERVDTFGRDLAYLYLSDGTMLNEHMVASGYAVAFIFPPNRRYEDRILAAEAAASAAGRGLWGEWGFTCRPADFRRDRC